MEGPRGCKKEELTGVIDLINRIFRESEGYNPTIGEEFPLLLSEENSNNMRIIVEDGKPVADVNFYTSNLLIEGTFIKAASVGAVCTDKEYQGRGYSTIILDDAEKAMKENGVDIMLVSGGRSLYLRRGCCHGGRCYEAKIKAQDLMDQAVEMESFRDEDIRNMASLYSMDSTRYYRSFYEFKMLLNGGITPWGRYTYKVYLIKQGSETVGYVILRGMNNESDYMDVVEFAGNREAVYRGLMEIAYKNSLRYVKIRCSFKDEMYHIIKRENLEYEETHLQGTIKIINFISLMEKLRTYFNQYVDKETVDKMIFKEADGRWSFIMGDERVEISDSETLVKLIFGDKTTTLPYMHDKSNIKKFVDRVFPIPFVMTDNLNFQ